MTPNQQLSVKEEASDDKAQSEVKIWRDKQI